LSSVSIEIAPVPLAKRLAPGLASAIRSVFMNCQMCPSRLPERAPRTEK
jgi:hypothetical protein